MSENVPKFAWVQSVVPGLMRLSQWLRRTIAFVVAVLTVWVIIGSVWFPGWWSAAIFGGLLFNGPYWSFALEYLFVSEVWLMFGLAGLGLAAVAAGVLLPKVFARFFKVVDRWAILIVAICAFGLLVDIRFLYRSAEEWPARYFQEAFGMQNEHPLSPPEKILAPVDFYYLDPGRIADIYSEIEPALTEEKRTLSTERKLENSAGVDGGGVTLKAEASKRGEETSEFKRSDLTAARKCLDLMRFTLRSGLSHYYTSIFDFYTTRGTDRWGGFSVPKTQEELAKQMLVAREYFRQEAKGWVIVDGEFHISRVNGNTLFEEEFAPPPGRIVFRFKLPAQADSALYRDGNSIRVFGDVIQPLDKNGVVEIYPLAVFQTQKVP